MPKLRDTRDTEQYRASREMEALSAVLKFALARGVIPLDAGSWDSVLRIMPSVVISEELIDDAATVLEEAFASLA